MQEKQALSEMEKAAETEAEKEEYEMEEDDAVTFKKNQVSCLS